MDKSETQEELKQAEADLRQLRKDKQLTSSHVAQTGLPWSTAAQLIL